MNTFILDDNTAGQTIPENTEHLIVRTAEPVLPMIDIQYIPHLKRITMETENNKYNVTDDGKCLYDKMKHGLCYIVPDMETLYVPPCIADVHTYIAIENPSLKAFVVDEQNPHLVSENGMLLDKKKETLLLVPPRTKELTIPETVRDIEDMALRACADTLECVTIPKYANLRYAGPLSDLTKLRELHILCSRNFTTYGIAPESSVLEKIEIGVDNTHLLMEDGILYNHDKTMIHRCLCTKTGDFTVPDTVKHIMPYAFCHTRLRSISLPASYLDAPASIKMLEPRNKIFLVKSETLEKITLQKPASSDRRIYLTRNITDTWHKDVVIAIESPKLNEIAFSDITFSGELVSDYFDILLDISRLLDKKYTTAGTILTNIRHKNKKLLLSALLYCFKINPELTVKRIQSQVLKLGRQAVEENHIDFIQMLLDKRLLKKIHLDDLLPLSISLNHADITLRLMDYKKQHTRYKDPADTLKL